MNIMFEDSITDEIKQKYTVLELDTFQFADIDRTSTAFCLIENIPIQEMFTMDQFLDLHKNLIKNYKLKNWKFCEDAIEHLIGKWDGKVDSFYETLLNRIKELKKQDLDPSWNGVITRDS